MADLSQPTSQSLSTMQPTAAVRVAQTVTTLQRWGHSPYVHETKRSTPRQDWLFATGKSKLRGSAGKHTQGLAADIVDGRVVHGHRVLWGASLPAWGLSKRQQQDREKAAKEFFDALGRAAALAGLGWGGSWTSFKDPAHVELGGAVSTAISQAGTVPAAAYHQASRVPWYVWVGGGTLILAAAALTLRKRG